MGKNDRVTRFIPYIPPLQSLPEITVFAVILVLFLAIFLGQPMLTSGSLSG